MKKSTSNKLSYREDTYNFWNNIFGPKEITISCSGSRISQQDMISSIMEDNSHMMIVALPVLILLSMLAWLKFRCDTSAMLKMILQIAMN